jgi:hypothetical protein
VDSDSTVNTYFLSTPYDINEKGQGEFTFQRTLGETNTRGVGTQENSTSASVRYVQRFLQNKVIRIPILGWKLRFEQALEWTLFGGTERIRKDSPYEYYRVRTDRYQGTTQFKYNALKNILISFDFTRETNLNLLDPKNSYNLWRGALSLEARF